MAVKFYWCRTCGRGSNFGDQLGPRLLDLAGIAYEWAPPDAAKLVTAGSVLSKFKPGWRGTVWGTGFIQDIHRVSLSKARVLSVRGELTRVNASLPVGTPLSDPGVLVGDLMRPWSGEMSGKPLLVPHAVDHDMAHRHEGVPVADICGDPQALLEAISAADLVYTSSLHAMIAADALGVWHVYEPHDGVTGGAFKFNDYLSAFGESARPGVERLTPHPAMIAKQAQARAELENLSKLL